QPRHRRGQRLVAADFLIVKSKRAGGLSAARRGRVRHQRRRQQQAGKKFECGASWHVGYLVTELQGILGRSSRTVMRDAGTASDTRNALMSAFGQEPPSC